MIAFTNTIIQPYTMMIHPFYAPVTLTTMPNPRKLHIIAFLAEFSCLNKEFVLKSSIGLIMINMYCIFNKFSSLGFF